MSTIGSADSQSRFGPEARPPSSLSAQSSFAGGTSLKPSTERSTPTESDQDSKSDQSHDQNSVKLPPADVNAVIVRVLQIIAKTEQEAQQLQAAIHAATTTDGSVGTPSDVPAAIMATLSPEDKQLVLDGSSNVRLATFDSYADFARAGGALPQETQNAVKETVATNPGAGNYIVTLMLATCIFILFVGAKVTHAKRSERVQKQLRINEVRNAWIEELQAADREAEENRRCLEEPGVAYGGSDDDE